VEFMVDQWLTQMETGVEPKPWTGPSRMVISDRELEKVFSERQLEFLEVEEAEQLL